LLLLKEQIKQIRGEIQAGTKRENGMSSKGSDC
jgi:hypothetical protein